ncbi:MAG: DUF423 domain-containing protein [Bacteroidota bacterium]
MKNRNLAIACVHMAVAIILGALGAHKLKELLSPEKLASFHTGVEYHIYHAIALLIINSSGYFDRVKGLNTINLLFNLGILFFSVSIYLLSTIEISGMEALKMLGPVTPLGGLLFIIGWIFLAIRLFSMKTSD